MPFTLSGSDITSSFVQVSNLSGWANFPTSASFGNNSFGQLGVTTVTTNISSPVVIGAVSTVYNSWIDAAFTRSGTGLALIDQYNQSFFAGTPPGDTTDRSSPVQVGPLSTWAQISGGNGVGLVIQTNGTLWSWGYNSAGQLGSSNVTNRSSPVQVGTLSTWTQVASGQLSSYGIQSDGTLWSWGSNANGQLGNNSNQNRSSPVQAGLQGGIWKSISMSAYNSTLGIQSNGTLWAWGNNSFGQLGTSNQTNYSSPVQIGTLSTWSQVSTGVVFTIAIQSDGTLWSWGTNVTGQLGLSDTTNRSSPVQVGTNSNWAQIFAGYYSSIAIQSNGTLWAWGENIQGELGLGDLTNRSSPVQVGTLSTWSQVTNGGTSVASMAAIQSNGTLWMWGINSYGQLGVGSAGTIISTPVQVGSLSTWTQVSIGNSFTVGLQNNGTIWTWGNNSFGQLGTQNFNNRSSPVQVAPYYVNNWSAIRAFGSSVLALQSSGSLWGWGLNSYGQLGTTYTSYSPVQISLYGASGWKLIIGGDQSTAMLQNNGSLWTAGLNSFGQLGTINQTNYSSLIEIGARPWTRIFSSAFALYFLGIQNDGSLWGSGSNSYGQLGVGSSGANISSPVQIGAFNLWSQLSASPSHVLAIQSNGVLWAWGNNSFGQLGVGSAGSNVPSPVMVNALYTWSKVSAGQFYSAAITTDNKLWAWGLNSYGQLGVGSAGNYVQAPVQVGTSATPWASIACGYYGSTVAIQTNGTLWAWGNNSYSQLGTSNQTNYSSPVQVGILSTWSQVSAGTNFTMALQTSGTLWEWGSNSNGQLGLGNPGGFPTSAYPVQYLNNTFGGFKKVTASASQVYYQTVNDTIVQASIADIPLIDSTNTISWKSYDTGQYHFVGVKSDGTAWSIGNNSYGQLGYSTTTISIFNATSVVAKSQSVFAVTSTGTLWAWGLNSWGQLGTNNQTNYSTPVQVGTSSNWTNRVATAINHTLALQSNGTLWSWGRNESGQLGQNDLGNKFTPTQVGALSQWSQVACGYSWSIAVQSNGSLWTWGNNNVGQLGLNTSTTYSSPVQVGALSNWAKLSSGQNFWHSIQSDGTLWTCGYNNNGQLGLNDTTNRSSPVQVGTLSNWAQTSGGRFFAAGILSNGTMWTWGSNSWGQLGLNTLTNYSSPVQVGALSQWSQVACGYYHTVALQSNGTLWVWGNNSYGQLGMNNSGNFSSPIQIGTSSNWAQISCGYSFTVALQSNGTLWAWGQNNNYGQLGLNTSTNYSSPVQAGVSYTGNPYVTTLTQIGSGANWSTSIAADYGSMLIDNSNNAWVFGNNNQYQLGLSDTTNRSSPVQIIGPSRVTTAAMDNYNICLIDNNNNLWLGGTGNSNNFNGQLPFGDISSPVQIGNLLSGWAQVSIGFDFTMALKNDGSLWAWGLSSFGQTGQSNTTFRSSPIQVGTASYWSQISCGYGHTLALQNNGSLWVWGYNAYGQLGNNASGTNILSPIQLGVLSTWSKLSAGYAMSAALQSNGTLWTWGQNNNGQLGLSNTTNRSSPTQVGTLSTWTQVSSSWFNTAAIQSNGTLWTWGYNVNGQLGLGDLTSRSSPVQVGALNTWTQVACGYGTLAIQSNGTLWSWGSNSWGQLGVGSYGANILSPVQVGALSNWARIASTNTPGFTALALQSNGTLWTWGNNSYGQLGLSDQTHRSSPTQVGTLSVWTQVMLGGNNGNYFYMSGIQSNGTLWAWGSSFVISQPQIIRIASYPYLAQQSTNNYWSSVKTNQNSTLLIATNNTFWSYGSNTFGGLGSAPNTTAYQYAVTQFSTLNNGTKIETKAGSSIIFAL